MEEISGLGFPVWSKELDGTCYSSCGLECMTWDILVNF